ncbi:MAG: FG-GAP-like repeat-containing protein [Sulfuricaulis sp.]
MLQLLRRSAFVLSCLLIQTFFASSASAITSPIGYASTASCSTSPPPLKSGTDPGFPGQWWNPNRYGTGWDIYFSNNRSQVVMYWLTYDANHQPIWLFNGGSTTMDASNEFWAPLYQVNQVVGSTNTTAAQVGYISIAFVPGSSTVAAIRWKWNAISTSQTYDECIYNFFYGTPSSTPGALVFNQSFTGSWYNPNQSGWGLDVDVGTYPSGTTYEIDNALIYDKAGNPVWLQGTIKNPALSTMADSLGYFKSNYSLTTNCSKSYCTNGTYIGSLTRTFTGSQTGNATLTATQTTGQVIAWPNATYSPGSVPIAKLSDNDIVSVDQTNCQVSAGQTCPVVVSWSSHLTTALVYKRDLTTGILSTTPLNNLANGQYTDNLAAGADVQYEMHNGSPTGTLMYTSAEVKVTGPNPLATPVSATPAFVAPPARDSVSDSVGATLANFRVDEGGNSTYSIPIQIPPGTAGVAPKLSLSYNSRLPNGVMGPGWSIAGSSQITRCRQTREDGDFLNGTTPVDGNPPPVNFTSTDRYCMDGVRLMLLTTSATGYGADQSLYSPENDPSTLVTAHVSNAAAGPDTFTVQRKDGTTSTYGNTSASTSATITATLPSASSVNVNWNLARMQDSTGNYIDYLYKSHPSGTTFPFSSAAVEFVLSQVNYTGHATSPVSLPYASVTFNYTTQPIGQVRLGYQAGVAFLQSQQLASVSVTNNGTMMRYYALAYQTSASGSGLQQLSQVQECRDNYRTVCFPATTFAWSQANYSYVADTVQTNGPSFNNIVGYKIADIDGDGRQDLVYALDGDSNCPGVSAIYVGFLDQTASHQMTLVTFNQKPTCSLIDLANNDQAWYLVDYNGDGRADLMMGGAAGSNWVIYPSLGRPTSGNPAFNSGQNLLATLKTPITVPTGMNAAGVLADLNGDGLPDFIYPAAQTGFANAAARLMVRQGDGTYAFSDPYNITFSWAPGDTNCTGVNTNCDFNFFYNDTLRKSAIAADIDGDGRADITLSIIAQTDTGGTLAPQGNGQPAFNPAVGTGQAITSPQTVTNKFYWYQFTASTITPPNGTTPGSIAFTEYWNSQVGVNGIPGIQSQFYVVDLNGDGLADILYQDSGTATTYHAMINTGHGYQAPITVTGITSNNTSPAFQLADINGDGRMDLVYPSGNNAYDFVSVVPSASGNGWAFSAVQAAPAGIHTGPGWIAFFGDFDGDGVPDFLSIYPSSAGLIYSSRVAGGTGCSSASNSASCSRYQAHDVISGITNGLGATTTLTYQPLTNNGVYLSGTAPGAGALYNANWGYGSPVFSVLAPMYVVSAASSSAPVRGNPGATSTVYYQYEAARMQAGGRGFLGFSKIFTFDGNDEAATGQFVLTQTQYNQSFPFTGTPSHTGRRVYTGALTRGSNAVDTCATNDPENGTGCFGTTVWPAASGMDFGDKTMVVSFSVSAVTCSGNGCAPVSSTYCSNPGNVAVYIEPHTFTVPAVPQPVYVYTQATDDQQFDLVSSATLTEVSNYFCYQDAPLSRTNNTDTDLTAATTVTKDGNGNVVAQKYVVNSYNDNASSWFLGRMAHSDVTFERPGEPNIDRTTDFTYDPTTGLLTSEEIEKGQGANLDLLTMYTLDAYGNRTGAYQCSNDLGTANCASTSVVQQQSGTQVHRYARTNFDSVGRYSTSSILPFNGTSGATAITVNSRDEFGNPTQQSSINGLIQYSEAGALGRPYFGSDNTGKATTTTFRLCTAVSCPSDAKFRSQTGTVGGPTSWTYFDVLGRAILKVGQAFDANPVNQSFSAVCSYFDAHNRPAYQSEPFFLPATINSTDGSPTLTSTLPCTGAQPAASTKYDILGRVVQVNDPDGGVVYNTYSGLVTTTSNPRNSSWVVTETRNALGELVSRQDPTDTSNPGATGLLVTNGYDSAGNLLTVTRSAGSGNIVTQATYDALGRKSTLSDPDAGGMIYAYNAAGDVISQTDAKSQTISQSYDAMGRRWQRAASGITDTWNYDGSNGYGLLASESRTQSGNPTFSRSMTYDSYGRLYQRTTSIAGTAYTETTAYDSHGRLLAQQDASGYSVYPQYSPNGFVSQQNDSRVGNVYQLMGTNAQGEASLDERAGQAALSSSYYYDAMGRISTICTGTNCALQDLSYQFDMAGNLYQRTRAAHTAPTIEKFTNDALNRLTLGQLTEIQGVVQGTAQTTTSMTYDMLGNICTKNGTVYSYAGLAGCANHGSIGSPQAVISAGGNTYGYDPDGNQTSGAGRILSYNAFNQLISASSGSISTTFLYTPEGERFMRTDSSGTTTYYIGRIEKLVTGSTWEIRRYLPGGAIDYVRSSGSNETRYTFTDHLGSLDVVATAAGAIYETASFDAFGSLRNSVNWSGAGATPTSTTHGFTGHEEIYSLGLTHMNGRIYDPVLGRMLQADPLTGPGNQSLNRYSYVVNNPLALTDPSGYSWFGHLLRTFDPLGPWSQIQETDRLAQNPYIRLAGAIVASYFTFGASYAYLADAGWSAAAAGAGASAAAGFVSGAIQSDSLQGGVYGAFSAELFYGIGSYFQGAEWAHDAGSGDLNSVGFTAKIIAHGVAGGVMSSMEGGKFGDGFIGAGVSEGASPVLSYIRDEAGRVTVAAIVGGTASEISGGKFANGAFSAAFGQLFNDEAHKLSKQQALRAYNAGMKYITAFNALTPDQTYSLPGVASLFPGDELSSVQAAQDIVSNQLGGETLLYLSEYLNDNSADAMNSILESVFIGVPATGLSDLSKQGWDFYENFETGKDIVHIEISSPTAACNFSQAECHIYIGN